MDYDPDDERVGNGAIGWVIFAVGLALTLAVIGFLWLMTRS